MNLLVNQFKLRCDTCGATSHAFHLPEERYILISELSTEAFDSDGWTYHFDDGFHDYMSVQCPVCIAKEAAEEAYRNSPEGIAARAAEVAEENARFEARQAEYRREEQERMILYAYEEAAHRAMLDKRIANGGTTFWTFDSCGSHEYPEIIDQSR